MKPIGAANAFQTFVKRNNNWSEGMNDNLLKAAAVLHGSVRGIVSSLPGSPAANETYIRSTDNAIYVWVPARNDLDEDNNPITLPAEWFVITPIVGMSMLVEDQEKVFWFGPTGWEEAWDLNAVHRSLEREVNLHIPYLLRNNSVLYEYVAGVELTIEAGAPGSGAFLDVAATDDVVFQIKHNGTNCGTISFDSGSIAGDIDFPGEVVVYPALVEHEYARAQNLTIHSPADTFGAQGLGITFRAKIRAID